MFNFTIPVEVVSEANKREHWRKKHKRSSKQRLWARAKMTFECSPILYCAQDCKSEFHITLIRLKGKGQRDFDGDNLQSAFKAIRDGIADALGIDDGSDRLVWEYRQEKGTRAAVRVEIEEKSDVTM